MAETYLEDIKIDRPVTDDAFDTAAFQDKMSMYRDSNMGDILIEYGRQACQSVIT